MRLCSKCGAERDRRGQRFCRKCHAEYMRTWRQKVREEGKSLRIKVNEMRKLLAA